MVNERLFNSFNVYNVFVTCNLTASVSLKLLNGYVYERLPIHKLVKLQESVL